MSHISPNGNELQEIQKEDEAIVLNNDNPIDPVTGLTQLEKDFVQQSWHHVRQDLKAAGLGFFHAYVPLDFLLCFSYLPYSSFVIIHYYLKCNIHL